MPKTKEKPVRKPKAYIALDDDQTVWLDIDHIVAITCNGTRTAITATNNQIYSTPGTAQKFLDRLGGLIRD